MADGQKPLDDTGKTDISLTVWQEQNETPMNICCHTDVVLFKWNKMYQTILL